MENPKHVEVKIVQTKRSKFGYIVHYVDYMYGNYIYKNIKCTYTDNGEYIGDLNTAQYLYKRGIIPQYAHKEDVICSIGFCKKEQKWYGWGVHGIAGFGVGYKINEYDTIAKGAWAKWIVAEDEIYNTGYSAELETRKINEDHLYPPGTIAKTLEDAKQFAISYANGSISNAR